ncbi:MAG: hypothetical protein U9R08_00620 [Nanoarchaeota archaeon]|nr:hypothetical protein [Nanoarchaeota archaeon]
MADYEIPNIPELKEINKQNHFLRIPRNVGDSPNDWVVYCVDRTGQKEIYIATKENQGVQDSYIFKKINLGQGKIANGNLVDRLTKFAEDENFGLVHSFQTEPLPMTWDTAANVLGDIRKKENSDYNIGLEFIHALN